MDEQYAERLAAKLAPPSIFLTLSRAGSFLCAYELIKTEIIDNVRNFYLRGFDETGLLYDEEGYRRHVLAKDPTSKYKASCAWLVEGNALTTDQVATLEDIRDHRNEIAHEIAKFLVDPNFEVKTDLLEAAAKIIQDLGVFWGSIEVDTNPDYDGQEVDYEGIRSGSSLLMSHLLESIANLNAALDKAETSEGGT